MTNDAFIQMIGDAARKLYSKSGILPSLTVAQAVLESNWGKSGLSKKYHNYFGMKWAPGCGCEYVVLPTKEQRKDGTYITVNAKFRRYDSAEEGIAGYYEFLSSYKRYHNLRGVTDAERACDLMQADGWATCLTYATKLKRLITKYNLTRFDTETKEVTEMSERASKPRNYTVCVSAIRVRTGPGTMYPQKLFTEMTKQAQKSCASRKSTGLAFYVKGVTFTALEEIKVSDDEIWAKTPSGYVALKYGGKWYVE